MFPPGSSTIAAPQNRRILIVDDNHSIHEDYLKILAGDATQDQLADLEAEFLGQPRRLSVTARYQIDSAFQGQQALELVKQACAQQRPYALAFVDMRMPPGWDGLETVTRLWQVDASLEVVICTAYSDRSWREIRAQLGHPDQLFVLKKPFDTIEVMQLADALCHKHALRQLVQQRLANLSSMEQERTAELEAANLELRRQMHERERMENELRLAQKLEGIGQLAAGVAHEINTPAQYVGDNISFLQDSFADLERVLAGHVRLLETAQTHQPLSDVCHGVRALHDEVDLAYLRGEIPKAIAQSMEGIGHIAKIVLAMKNFSHVGGDDKVLSDLNEAVRNTVTVSRNEWKYVAEIEYDLASDLPPVPCVVSEINQVLLNLVVNAAHAIADCVRPEQGEKGQIRIVTRKLQGHVELRVQDTGGGIPKPIRDRIFDPFFTTKEVGKGTGQGLPIARTVVVNKHGGTLDVETEVGKGTTFIVRLPLEASVAKEGGEPMAAVG